VVQKEHKFGFAIDQLEFCNSPLVPLGKLTFWPGMSHADILKTGISSNKDFSDDAPNGYQKRRL